MSSPSSPSELIVFPDAVYRRSGVCDGCRSHTVTATCCRYVYVPDRLLTRDETHWLHLHGLTAEVARNVRIDVDCGALEDGGCALFGKPERPQMCINYPELPGLDPVCSYRFEQVT